MTSSKSQIIRSTGIIGIATFTSRVLGFARDILIAKFFGTGISSEAFVVAFRIPNMLRELVGEGAANAAFVPVFSEYLVKEKKELKSLIKVMFYIMVSVLSILVILGIVFSPLIVRLIAPGFSADLEKFNLTIKLTRLMFPYLLFIALTAFFISILHTHKAFIVPAFGPCLLNISFIVMIIFFSKFFREPVFVLAWAVILGGIFQLIIHLPALLKRGIGKEYFFGILQSAGLRHPGLKKIKRVFFPRVFGAGLYQLNIFIDTICASLSTITGRGAVAAIYYSNRLIQLPLSIFAVALSSVMLPEMARRVSQNDREGLRSILSFSLKAISFIMFPISIGLFILAQPLTKLIFQRGEFSAYSTDITSLALLFYSLGLFFYAGAMILRTCFYSLQDTITPVKTSAICLIINTILNLILMFPLKVGGLALASSLSAMFNFTLLYLLLKKRIGGLQGFGLKEYVFKIILASLLMGFFTMTFWQSSFLDNISVVKLMITVVGSIMVFGLACIVLRIKELNQILRWILRR